MKMTLALLFTFGLYTSALHAEVLLIEAIAGEPVNSSEGLMRPSRGMTMDRVRKKFGDPSNESAAVGEPPITSWEYPGYTVYFEYQHVLTSVVHRN